MDLSQVYGGPVTLPPLDLPPGDRDTWRVATLEAFERHLYGAVPPPPDDVTVQRVPMGHGLWHLKIAIQHKRRSFYVDAALWLPSDGACERLILGLDFIGPLGVLTDRGYPLDPEARGFTRPELGSDGRQHDIMRGATAYRWPVEMLLARNTGLLLSCYGSWAPDDPALCHTHGVARLMQVGAHCGALSLWAWALMRLVDVATSLPDCANATFCTAGHSRLGKAALWASACDTRIDAVYANNAGCAGPALSRHSKGETLAELRARFPHWLSSLSSKNAEELPFDQHHLIALCAPRAVYLACAVEDCWSDPVGSYLSLKAATDAWSLDPWRTVANMWQPDTALRNGPLGWHLRSGGHDMLPYDWAHVLDWLASTSSAIRKV